MGLTGFTRISEINTVKMGAARCITKNTSFTFHYWKPASEDCSMIDDTCFASILINNGSEKGYVDSIPHAATTKSGKRYREKIF